MRQGLWLSAPEDALLCAQAVRLMDMLDIPLAGFVGEESALFRGDEGRTAFLYRVSEAVFRGQSIPAELVLRHLSGDAMPANVLRRHLEWQRLLSPYLNAVEEPEEGQGFFYLGDQLIVCPMAEAGTVDALLPGGQWTDIMTGEVASGRFRRMRSPNALPILAAEGAVIPTGEAAYPTLHWYQAPENAVGMMHQEPYHLILHRDGTETWLR